MKKIFVVLTLTLAGGVLAYGTWGKMNGEIAISTSPLADSNPNNALVVYIVIKDRAAKRIFENMKGIKAQTSECGDPSIMEKSAGNLRCYKQDTVYSCDIGINLQNGKSEFGRPC